MSTKLQSKEEASVIVHYMRMTQSWPPCTIDIQAQTNQGVHAAFTAQGSAHRSHLSPVDEVGTDELLHKAGLRAPAMVLLCQVQIAHTPVTVCP